MDGTIIVSGQLNGSFVISGQLSGGLNVSGQLSGSIDPGGSSIPPYEGDYTVEPHIYEQVLETRNKRMTDDLTINEILLSEVVNPQGGTTLIIE